MKAGISRGGLSADFSFYAEMSLPAESLARWDPESRLEALRAYRVLLRLGGDSVDVEHTPAPKPARRNALEEAKRRGWQVVK